MGEDGIADARLSETNPKRGAHRKRRERRPLPGMMLHIDASRHRWIPALNLPDEFPLLLEGRNMFFASVGGDCGK